MQWMTKDHNKGRLKVDFISSGSPSSPVYLLRLVFFLLMYRPSMKWNKKQFSWFNLSKSPVEKRQRSAVRSTREEMRKRAREACTERNHFSSIITLHENIVWLTFTNTDSYVTVKKVKNY